MSTNNVPVPARELATREFNALRGKLCSVIEAMGIPHSQERAAVALVKQYTYDSQTVLAQLVDMCEDQKFQYSEKKVENAC